MSAVFRHTLGRLRPEVIPDAHGNDQLVYPSPDEAVPMPGWAIDATGTSEDTDARAGTLTRLQARGPYDADVLASDRLLWSGVVYRIEGDVQRQPGPSSRTSHTILSLKFAKG